MAKLVLYTFGILQQPCDHEQINGFHDRNPFVYTSAENSEALSAEMLRRFIISCSVVGLTFSSSAARL